jgi:hypothetical protein
MQEAHTHPTQALAQEEQEEEEEEEEEKEEGACLYSRDGLTIAHCLSLSFSLFFLFLFSLVTSSHWVESNKAHIIIIAHHTHSLTTTTTPHTHSHKYTHIYIDTYVCSHNKHVRHIDSTNSIFVILYVL